MYRKGIFVATSFAVVTGLVTFFQASPFQRQQISTPKIVYDPL